MKFFDANTSIGLDGRASDEMTRSFPVADELLRAMDAAGIERALVGHAGAEISGIATNDFLAEETRGHHDRLISAWTYLPHYTGELPPWPEFFLQMAEAGTRALRIMPNSLLFPAHKMALEEDFSEFAHRHIPLILDWSELKWDTIYRLAADFPENVFIVSNVRLWPSDRFMRPLMAKHAHLYVETSKYWCAGGLADLVANGYGERLLFGSGMPKLLAPAAMMEVRHADIAEEPKRAIAYGNLARLLDAVDLEG
ncbi:MAG: hypothetical protein J6Y54_07905 [Lentisphaeria bacterium]|nr:hypothetical protein [Lentisphaeria bacterium]